jgi:RNA polymerase sigma-70 factor (ECF subfamily)
MRQAAEGRDAAFGELAQLAGPELVRFALAQGLSATDAADAAQESLLRAFEKRRSWRETGEVLNWLMGITMNVVREIRRRRRPGAFDASLLADAKAAVPASGLETAEELNLLAEAMQALPARQREAIACRFLRRLSVQETAAVMGCAQGTVKSAVFAALVALRKSLSGRGTR